MLFNAELPWWLEYTATGFTGLRVLASVPACIIRDESGIQKKRVVSDRHRLLCGTIKFGSLPLLQSRKVPMVPPMRILLSYLCTRFLNACIPQVSLWYYMSGRTSLPNPIPPSDPVTDATGDKESMMASLSLPIAAEGAGWTFLPYFFSLMVNGEPYVQPHSCVSKTLRMEWGIQKCPQNSEKKTAPLPLGHPGLRRRC